MQVEKEIDPGLKDRTDLVSLLDAAANDLAARDTDADTQARARWRLWRGPSGEPFIGLQLDDQEYSTARNFAPSQLTHDRDLRLISIWNDVLRERAWREVRHVNELISQREGG